MQEVRGGGEIAREEFPVVCQRRSHGFRQTVEVYGIKKNVGVLRQERVHFGEKSRRPPISQRGHIQNAETPL
jgi:hypothetical protein